MRSLIDDEGRLFGHVNVVDAIAVIGAVAFLIAGAVAVSGGSSAGSVATVELETTGPPYVLDAINDSADPLDEDVHWTGNARPHATFVIDDRADDLHERVTAARFDARIAIANRSGELHYRGQRLYVGRDATLDLGTTVVDVTVVDIGEVGRDGD